MDGIQEIINRTIGGELTAASAANEGINLISRHEGNSKSNSNNPSQHRADEQPKDTLNVGTIVGIVVGIVAVTLIIAAFVVWYRRQKMGAMTKESFHRSRSPTRLAVSGSGTVGSSLAFSAHEHIEHGDTGLPSKGSWSDPVIVAARIPLDKLEVDTLISRGGFGEVYRGFYHGQLVAIKKLLPANRKDLLQIEGFLHEVKLMVSLEHAHIVKFVGVAWDALSDLAVVSEFVEGGDLRQFLVRLQAEQRPRGLDADKLTIAMHIMHALTYLHTMSPVVLHRDLKSRNVLLTNNLEAKLTDFGVSREASDRTMTAGVGTCLWMAPEVMMGGRYNAKADMFSFGVLLSEMDTHLLPYSNSGRAADGRRLPDTAILQMVSMGKLRVRFSDGVPDAVRELGEACTSIDPTERPDAPMALYTLQQALQQSISDTVSF